MTKRKRLATIYRGESVRVAIDGRGRLHYRDEYRSGMVRPGFFAGFTDTALKARVMGMVEAGMPSPIAALIYRRALGKI